MKQYKVTLLNTSDAASLYTLCVKEAAQLLQNATFKPRRANALEHTTNLLMRQCKAFMIGLLKLDALYVDIPEWLQKPKFNSAIWTSTQTHWRTGISVKPYSIPAFNNPCYSPADEIPELLTYECIEYEGSCDMYNDILQPKITLKEEVE